MENEESRLDKRHFTYLGNGVYRVNGLRRSAVTNRYITKKEMNVKEEGHHDSD